MNSIPISTIQARLAGARARYNALVVEMQVLEGLIEDAGVSVEEVPDSGDKFVGNDVKLLPPREAIRRAIEERPGLTPTEIAALLEHKIDSRATDRRNVLRTTVAKLVHEGLIVRDGQNRCFPADHLVMERSQVP